MGRCAGTARPLLAQREAGSKSELALPRDQKAIAHVAREIEEYVRANAKTSPGARSRRHAVPEERLECAGEDPLWRDDELRRARQKLGLPNGARAVGLANGSNPIGLIVPCHRVIGADGSLTGYGGGLPLKRALLVFEAEQAEKPDDLFAGAAKRQ